LPSNETPYADEQIKALKIGKTTRNEVVKTLGEPAYFSHKPDAHIYPEGTYVSFNLLVVAGAPFAGGGANIIKFDATQTLIVQFDDPACHNAVYMDHHRTGMGLISYTAPSPSGRAVTHPTRQQAP